MFFRSSLDLCKLQDRSHLCPTSENEGRTRARVAILTLVSDCKTS